MRKFGVIGSRVWRSSKFRNLHSIEARLLYLYLHTSAHGNSAGCFHISPTLIAAETGITDVEGSLSDLECVGLIRRDSTEDLVQIAAFFTFNMPSSRKQLAGPLSVIAALPKGPVLNCACAELAIGLFLKAEEWDVKVEARGAFLHEAATLLKNGGKEAIISGVVEVDNDLKIALSKDLLIDLSNGLPIERTRTISHQDQDHGHGQDHGQDQYQDQGSQGGEDIAKDPASPPADSGRRDLPDDIREKIKSLGNGVRRNG